jgi:hypothetical protein
MHFQVQVVFEGEPLEVEGYYTPHVPARTNCENDDARPAEGGIDEIYKVSVVWTGERIALPRSAEKFLMEEKYDEIAGLCLEALDEAKKDAAAGAAEAKLDKLREEG